MASVSSEKTRNSASNDKGRSENGSVRPVIENSGTTLGVRPMSGGNRATIPSTVPPSSQCSYAACYCEENVYKICENVKRTAETELDKCYTVFISNKKRVVPLWRQKAGRDEEKLVIWDYHVIFMYKPDDRTLVYDLDSELPFPTYFHKYVTETFRTDAILNTEYHRHFRVVPAVTFLRQFASDRRHMRKEDGSWLKPPPPYPAISSATASHNLDEFISMEANTGVGDVYSLTEFVKTFYVR